MPNEERLIDANALLDKLANSSESWAKNLEAIRNWWPHAVGIKDNIVRLIKVAPTVDAVEVVRCKDCKHYATDHWCTRVALGIMYENDFCSYGERRSNDSINRD